MSAELIVYIARKRKQFVHEDFTGTDHIFALSESGIYTFDDGSGIKTVNPLEGVFFEKGVRFIRKTVTPIHLHLFRFKSDELPFNGHHVRFKNTDRILSTVKLLKKLNRNVLLQNDFSCKNQLFGDILNLYKIENADILEKEGIRDLVVESAIEFLNGNFCNKITLPDISAASGISYVQFSRRFKAAVGITPFEYLANLRLSHAQRLLANTELTVKEIAPLCGFENEYYFSNFFKKYKNISPSHFRAEL